VKALSPLTYPSDPLLIPPLVRSFRKEESGLFREEHNKSGRIFLPPEDHTHSPILSGERAWSSLESSGFSLVALWWWLKVTLEDQPLSMEYSNVHLLLHP